MAMTKVKVLIPNKGRRGGRRRNAARKMSPKQIRIFGTRAQKAALKAKRSRKAKTAIKARHKIHRTASRPRAVRRKNAGEIVGFTLANTGRRKRRTAGKSASKGVAKMAKTKTRARRRSAASGYKKHTKRRSTRRSNPGVKHHRRRSSRRNPGMLSGVGPLLTTSAFALAGAAGSKILTQMLLGANNTGWMGYLANGAVGFALWLAAEKILHNRSAATGIAIGTAVMILDRIINDMTPFGSYLSGAGFGDYQAQAFVTPQTLVDPYNSATIRIPGAWMPPPPSPSPSKSAAAVGVGGYGGPSLYGGGSPLY